MARAAYIPLLFVAVGVAFGALAPPPECGEICLIKAVTASTCSVQDKLCICTNKDLINDAEVCVLSTCSVRDALSTKNYSMNSCHAPVRDEGWSTLWLGMSFFIISFVFFFLRIISRVVGEVGFHTDDYLAIAAMISGTTFAGVSVPLRMFGLGKDIWTVPFDHITYMLVAYYHGEWIYALAIFFTKMSMLYLYLRIFPSKQFRIQVYCVMGAVVIYTLFGTVISVNQCTPIRGAWLYWDHEHHFRCMNRNALGWSSAIMNMALDIAIIVLPLRPLSKLAMEWRRKTQVMLMFMVGIFITIVSVIRLQSLVHFAHTTNPTWDYRQMGVWSQIEVHVGNVCACMPAVYSLMKKIWPTWLGTSKERTYTSDNSKQQISSRIPKKPRGDTEDEEGFVRLEEFDDGRMSVRVTSGV